MRPSSSSADPRDSRDFGYYLVHNDGDRLVVAENIPYRLLSCGGVDMRALYLDISLHLLDRALKLADVVLELLRYVFNDIVADIEVKRVRLALDYEHTGLEIRWLNVREERRPCGICSGIPLLCGG